MWMCTQVKGSVVVCLGNIPIFRYWIGMQFGRPNCIYFTYQHTHTHIRSQEDTHICIHAKFGHKYKTNIRISTGISKITCAHQYACVFPLWFDLCIKIPAKSHESWIYATLHADIYTYNESIYTFKLFSNRMTQLCARTGNMRLLSFLNSKK